MSINNYTTTKDKLNALTDWLADSPFLQIEVQQHCVLHQILGQRVRLRWRLSDGRLHFSQSIQSRSLLRCRRTSR